MAPSLCKSGPSVRITFARSLGGAETGSRNQPVPGSFSKPSDGLEPSTPSLPWKFRGGNGVHARSLVTTFVLESGPLMRASSARA